MKILQKKLSWFFIFFMAFLFSFIGMSQENGEDIQQQGIRVCTSGDVVESSFSCLKKVQPNMLYKKPKEEGCKKGWRLLSNPSGDPFCLHSTLCPKSKVFAGPTGVDYGWVLECRSPERPENRFMKMEFSRKGLLVGITQYQGKRKHGKTCSYYFDTGQKMKEGHFFHGEKDGLFFRWYKNGNLEFLRCFNKGKKFGLHVNWYKTGKKFSVWEYDPAGDLKSYKIWNEDGKIKQEN